MARKRFPKRSSWMASLSSFWMTRRAVVVRPTSSGMVWAWLFVAIMAWFWWSTAVSTSTARIAALQTVEASAFAVHEQLVRNFAETGRFFQTIHKGYDDAWTWSGHRALTLIFAGWVWPLAPSAFGLARLLVVCTLLGGIPAALVGRRAAGGAPVGLVLGGLAWYGSPVVMAMALQDYQDLAFAAPALVFAWWAMGSRAWILVPIGTFIGLSPREECVPMALAVAVLAAPGTTKRPFVRRLVNISLAAVVVGGYGMWAERYFPLRGSGHDMPLVNAVRGVTGGTTPYVFLDGWPYWHDFYADLLLPFGVLAVLGPEALLPAAGLVLLHMTVPVGHGVDRAWQGHAHHMAPAAAFMVLAMTLGAARLYRFGEATLFRGHRGVWAGVLCAGLAVVVAQEVVAFSSAQNIRLTFAPARPAFLHPAWTLADSLPPDAVPISSKDVSPVIASWERSFTYDESLDSKAEHQGLGAGTHLLVDSRDSDVLGWGMAMRGASVVAKAEPFVLLTWDSGAIDGQWASQRNKRRVRLPSYTGAFAVPEQIPGVPPRVSGQELRRSVPRIPLTWSAWTSPLPDAPGPD